MRTERKCVRRAERCQSSGVKTPEQRGPIGAWAYEARIATGLSPEQVAERLAIAGIEVRPSTIRGIEAGSKNPGRALLKALAGVYGSRPAPQSEAEEGDLAAAIRDQAEAIGRLADRLDAFLSTEWLAARVAEALRVAGVATGPAGSASPSDVRQTSSPGQ